MDPDTYLSQFIALFNHIEVYPPDLGATIALVLSVLLLGCSGFVSASEIFADNMEMLSPRNQAGQVSGPSVSSSQSASAQVQGGKEDLPF